MKTVLAISTLAISIGNSLADPQPPPPKKSDFCVKVGATDADCDSLEASCNKPCVRWWEHVHVKWANSAHGCMGQKYCTMVTGKSHDFKDSNDEYHNGREGERFCMPKGDKC